MSTALSTWSHYHRNYVINILSKENDTSRSQLTTALLGKIRLKISTFFRWYTLIPGMVSMNVNPCSCQHTAIELAIRIPCQFLGITTCAPDGMPQLEEQMAINNPGHFIIQKDMWEVSSHVHEIVYLRCQYVRPPTDDRLRWEADNGNISASHRDREHEGQRKA